MSRTDKPSPKTTLLLANNLPACAVSLLCMTVVMALGIPDAAAGGPAPPNFEIGLHELPKIKKAPKRRVEPARKKSAKPVGKPSQRAAAPAPVEPAAVPEKPATPPLQAIPARLSVRSLSGTAPEQRVDQLLSALSLRWTTDKVLESGAGKGGQESFSIKVDRYLELDGKRYVITGAGNDPYQYTMLRLLETAGYTVIRVDGQQPLPGVASQLLTPLGFAHGSGTYRFTLPTEATPPRLVDGVLVTLKSPGAHLFITETILDPPTVDLLSTALVEPVAAGATTTP